MTSTGRLVRLPDRWSFGEGVPGHSSWPAVAVGAVALNLLLFLPFYLVFSYENAFWPFFPLGHPRGPYDWSWSGLPRSVYEYLMQLFVRRHNLDIFRVSADCVFLLSTLVLLSRVASAWRRSALVAAGAGYALLLAFLVYSAFIHDLRAHHAALVDDVQLLYSAWVFVRDTWSVAYVVTGSVGLMALVGVGWLLGRYFQLVWWWRGGEFGTRSLVMVWMLLNAYSLSSLSWFGAERDDPIIQLQSKHVLYNWQRSRGVMETIGVLRSASIGRAAADAAGVVPRRRPDIYLFEVESYGASMWTDEIYAVAREGLTDRIQDMLEKIPLPVFSRFVTAPVHGGGSWMSTASVLSGIRIDTQTLFSAWKRLAPEYPHLVSYLKQHGYYTLAIQPGATWREDIYGYDDVIIRSDFAYDGPIYGFGWVPDQWALDYALTNYWMARGGPGFFHFFAVSTHFAWHPVPRITEDVEELREPQLSFIDVRPDYAQLSRTIPIGRRRDYFVTVTYEWELMLEVFQHRVRPGFVAFIFGDHQPPFISDGSGGYDVPLHVVTDMPEYLTWLQTAGFVPGVAPLSGFAQAFRMEGLYSFLLGVLTTEDGEQLQFDPAGLDLRAPRPSRSW